MQKTSQHLIAAVENGLRYPVRIKGQKEDLMTLQARMATYKVPGVSIAVVDQGKIIWTKGYGVTDVETHQPVDEHTLFQACSISKVTAALGLMLLVQKGKVDLETDVNTYLKRWKVPKKKPFENESLTLRQLLSHSGGVTVSGVEAYAEDEQLPTVFEFLNGDKPVSKNDAVEMVIKPGEFHYSGGGTTIIELLIEDITGMSFKEYIQEFVFDPLEMTRSFFVRPLPKEETNFATSHTEDGKAIAGKYHTYPSFSAAGLWTTPTDLAKLGLNIQKSLQGDKTGLLTQSLAKEMITPQVDAEVSLIGLGFFIRNDQKTFGHSGSNPGTRCNAAFTTEGQKGVVIMTNSDNGCDLEAELRFSVYDAYNWPLPLWLEKTIVKVDPSVLKTYAGEYWTVINEGTSLEKEVKTCTVITEKDHLIFHWLQHKDTSSEWTLSQLLPEMAVYPESPTSFFNRDGMTITFENATKFKAFGASHFRK